MALIKCEDCQTEMSSMAAACPKCARPNATLSPNMPLKAELAPKSDRKGSAVLGATLGFGVGFLIVQQGCGNGNWVPLALFGGAIFAILGAILGAMLG